MVRNVVTVAAAILASTGVQAANFIEVAFAANGARFDVTFNAQALTDPNAEVSVAGAGYTAYLSADEFDIYGRPPGWDDFQGFIDLSSLDLTAPSFHYSRATGSWSGPFDYFIAQYTFTAYGGGPINNIRITGTDEDRTPGINLTGVFLGPSSMPEPASWAMMLGGFGFIGGVMRRRQRAVISFG